MIIEDNSYMHVTSPPTHRPLILDGLGVQLARARFTHIALACKPFCNPYFGFAYLGSGNVVGGRPLGAIRIARVWTLQRARASGRRAQVFNEDDMKMKNSERQDFEE